MINKYLKGFGLPEKYLPAVIGDFLESLIQSFNPEDNLFIYGDVGTGKTWLLAALMRECLERSKLKFDSKTEPDFYPHNSLFISLPELMLQFRQSMDSESSLTEAGILRKYSKIKNLYFDDIGSEKTTEYVRASLYLLINRRADQIKTRTMITSNLSLNKIANQHGERIASRIAGMCKIIKLTGSDRRLEESK
jgi:DNA replication protein DnaC